MHIWTDTPIAEIWHQLRYLTSPANVNGILTGTIKSGRKEKWEKSDKIEEKAYEIASCIRQADEYFHASENVELPTKPLLQFYGTQSLIKALIVANNNAVTLNDFKYHGLNTHFKTARNQKDKDKLESYSGTPLSWEIEKEFAVVNDGVIIFLCETINDIKPLKGDVLLFKDLIQILPDLRDLFFRHYNEPSNCFYIYDEPEINPDGKYEIYFSANENIDQILKTFPEFNEQYDKVEKHRQPGFCSKTSVEKEYTPAFGKFEKGTIAGNYFIKPHPCGIYKSISVLYSAIYIIGNVARYKPAFWMKIIEGNESGSAAIVEGLCNVVRRRIPHEVLQYIWQEKFTFGSPGYLS